MTWEEAVIRLRKDKARQQLVQDAYLDENLELNAKRFMKSEEFSETLRLIKKYSGMEKSSLLDIGPGNGISCAAFSLNGWKVTCIEPDTSDTVGTGAILFLKKKLGLDTLCVENGRAEHLPFPDASFDIIYTRQCLHHAGDLRKFTSEAARVLKKNGIFFSLRDHVVSNEKQMKQFLQEHPLHHFYGGENAFTLDQYLSAIKAAGMKILRVFGPLDSVINMAPKTKKQIAAELRNLLGSKAGIKIPLSDNLLIRLAKIKTRNLESNAGRLYSFIAVR